MHEWMQTLRDLLEFGTALAAGYGAVKSWTNGTRIGEVHTIVDGQRTDMQNKVETLEAKVVVMGDEHRASELRARNAKP